MKVPNSVGETARSRPGREWGGFLLLLAGILGTIFWRSFAGQQVLRANDYPLGMLTAYADQFFASFRGGWFDLNFVGFPVPASVPSLTQLFYLVLASPWRGPDGVMLYAKFLVPCALAFRGWSAWYLCRTLKFNPWVCALAGVAAALHTDPFSNACWGLASWALCHGLIILAIAALVSAQGRLWFVKALLAGAATGLAIGDAYDTGAIFSLFVGAFALWTGLAGGRMSVRVVAQAGLRLALVGGFAALVAAAALSTLIGTQIQDVAGMGQTAQTKADRWPDATAGSFPKIETLRVLIPGLFGYLMNTSDGSAYWGSVGGDERVPGSRQSASGEYAGVLVVLLAGWAVAQACRRNGSPFSASEKRFVWFWAVAALVALCLAWGRHAPFYRLFYALPYASTLRQPIKWMQPFSVAIGILFACGLEAFARVHLSALRSVPAKGKSLWQALAPFERGGFWTLGALVGVSVLAFLAYLRAEPSVVSHLVDSGFPDQATLVYRFSLREVGWYLGFLIVSAALLLAIARGGLAGRNAVWGWACLAVLLVADLARANQPWIQYDDAAYRYRNDPIVERLRPKAYEHRVQCVPFRLEGPIGQTMGFLQNYSYSEWLQHLYPYFRIQSLDITQMSHPPLDVQRFRQAFESDQRGNSSLLPRKWELTGTRWLLGLSGEFTPFLNRNLDPGTNRFRQETVFNLVPKREPLPNPPRFQDFAAVLQTNGPFALIEFTGALPRAQLFSQWQVETNLSAVAQRLVAPDFDPHRTVIVSHPVGAQPAGENAAAGKVEISHYAARHIRLSAQAETPSVLLFNDKYDPSWKVWVDGRPGELLRCNLLMRGVWLAPGQHQVEFRYEPPIGPLYVSFAAAGASLLLLGALGLRPGRTGAPTRA